ncbi:MAG: DNA primase [Alphaproteobacteria bacterium]|nr:DNA primase [Alphaproteobacteria bacterium]MBM3652035.1 DNA primase [Alphaproteobacteria bacterium]
MSRAALVVAGAGGLAACAPAGPDFVAPAAPENAGYGRAAATAASAGSGGSSTLCGIPHNVDAATGEHGDLLDVIRESAHCADFVEAIDEARRFLSLPRDDPPTERGKSYIQAPKASSEAARRLFHMSRPILGTLAERYLRHRGVTTLHDLDSLRFHRRCYYRPEKSAAVETWPALIAAVTDLDGNITGAHRTWLDRSGRDKAPIATPRRAMGELSSNGVRFAAPLDVMAAGEGIETVLSVRCLVPAMPMVAALSSAHLAALLLPSTLRRLYVLRDNDAAGKKASTVLVDRATAEGIEAIALVPQLGDFNDDLRRLGEDALRAAIRMQLAPQDIERFLTLAA